MKRKPRYRWFYPLPPLISGRWVLIDRGDETLWYRTPIQVIP